MSEQNKDQKVYEEAVEHVKKEMEANSFSEKIVEAIENSSQVLQTKQKKQKLENFLSFLEEEEMEIPTSYHDKKESLEEEIASLDNALPEKIEAALEEITHRRLIKFISLAQSFKGGEEFSYIVDQLTDDQKEKIYHLIRSEEIKGWEDKELVEDFEQRIGYSMSFAKEKILGETHPDLEPFFGFVEKHLKGYNKRVKDTIDWLEEMKYANLNDKRIQTYAEKTLIRFGITNKSTEQEKIKEIADELLEIMKGYFPNYETQSA